jgi:hypothetical protein
VCNGPEDSIESAPNGRVIGRHWRRREVGPGIHGSLPAEEAGNSVARSLPTRGQSREDMLGAAAVESTARESNIRPTVRGVVSLH